MPANRRWHPWRDTIAAGALLIVFALIFRRIVLLDHDDDQFFLRALNDRSLFEFVVWRYETWSGRTLIECLLATTIGFPLVWKLGIPTAFIGAGYCIWRLTLSERLPAMTGTLMVVVLMLFIGRSVRMDAVYWVTGFYNYLLPYSLGLLALVVLQSPALRSRLLYPVALPGTVVCCQTEQGAFVMLAILAGLVAFKRVSRESYRAEIVLLSAGMIASAALLLAPGNQVRHTIELRWLPEFVEMDLVEKLALGLDRINTHAQSQRNFLLMAAAGLATWTTWSRCRTFPARSACTILMLFLASALAAAVMRNTGMDEYVRYAGVRTHLSPEEWLQGGIFVSYAFTICVFGALMTSAACRAESWASRVTGIGLPLLAVLSTLMVSLSPTIYASLGRVLFIGDLLLVAHCGQMLAEHLGARESRCAEKVPVAGTT